MYWMEKLSKSNTRKFRKMFPQFAEEEASAESVPKVRGDRTAERAMTEEKASAEEKALAGEEAPALGEEVALTEG